MPMRDKRLPFPYKKNIGIITMAQPELSEDNLDIILEKMYVKKRWDFRRYRKSSLRRCIERRLASYRLHCKDYIEFLDVQPLEFNNLFNQLTIKVSEFFRDTDVFNQIEQYVIPEVIVKPKTDGNNSLRIWSIGCARGEEAYSIAILLSKIMRSSTQHALEDLKVKIFATDIEDASVDIARKGIYCEESLKNVDLFQLGQFFKPSENYYQVSPQIRNLVTFGVHDIVSNIHLSHMDIICCRNLLIYFEKDLQEKVFEKFWYSLNSGGYIILGRSEVVPSIFRDRFRDIFRKEKIYQKI